MFCVNCGEELKEESIKFCPYCGNKIGWVTKEELAGKSEVSTTSKDSILLFAEQRIHREKIREPLKEVDWNSDRSEQEEIYRIFCSHMGASSQYGESLYIKGQDKIDRDDLEYYEENYEVDDPIMIFKYGLLDGFAMDWRELTYSISENIGSIKLSEIENVVYDKRLLAPVMYFYLKEEQMSQDIYLTGIRKPEEFVNKFRNFIFEINHIEYEKNETENDLIKETGGSDLDLNKTNKLGQICFENRFHSSCCEIGNPISKKSNRLALAMDYFNIDFNINTYLIYDSSVSGNSCKEGFALCDDGFHYRCDKQTGVIPWEYFGDVKIKKFLNCVNLDGMIFPTALETKKLIKVLIEVQDYFKEK